MRYSLLIFSFWFLLFNCSVFAQSKADLRQKYGEPITETENTQTFIVRRNLILKVTYSGNVAVEFQIYPDESNRIITAELSKELSEELFPTSKRLLKIFEITFSGGCSSSRSIIYENVTIYESINCVVGITKIHIIRRDSVAMFDFRYVRNGQHSERFFAQKFFPKREEPQFLRP